MHEHDVSRSSSGGGSRYATDDARQSAGDVVDLLIEVVVSGYRAVPGPAPLGLVVLATGFLVPVGWEVLWNRSPNPYLRAAIPAVAAIYLLAIGLWTTRFDRSHEKHASALMVSMLFMAIATATVELILYLELSTIGPDFDWLMALYPPLAVGAIVGAPTGLVLDGIIVRQQELDAKYRETRHLNQRLTVVTRVLRHNVRNELTVALGALSIVRPVGSNPETDRWFEKIERALNRLLDHAEKMVQLDREDVFDATVEEVDIATYLEGFSTRDPFDSTDATVRVDVPPEARVRAHPLVGSAIVEVVENAVEHADEPVTVRLTVEPRAEWVVITVVDDGPGIPENEYAALESGEDPLTHGQGVGLWFVKWVIEASDGTLSFETNASSGTTVRFELPRVQ
ncbi:MAG: ATP-binding protein [Halanaeroarchaeum sp.]